MDFLAPEYEHLPAAKVFDVARELPDRARLVLVIKGQSLEGEDVGKTVAVRLGPKGEDGRKRLAEAGLTISALGDQVQVAAVKFGSRAKKSGFEQGFEIVRVEVPSGRPSPQWFYVPALLLVGFVWWVQGRRLAPRPASAAAA
jgi:hypothetical protein